MKTSITCNFFITNLTLFLPVTAWPRWPRRYFFYDAWLNRYVKSMPHCLQQITLLPEKYRVFNSEFGVWSARNWSGKREASTRKVPPSSHRLKDKFPYLYWPYATFWRLFHGSVAWSDIFVHTFYEHDYNWEDWCMLGLNGVESSSTNILRNLREG